MQLSMPLERRAAALRPIPEQQFVEPRNRIDRRGGQGIVMANGRVFPEIHREWRLIGSEYFVVCFR